ncbi:6396_t:CDS:2 [Funneliformis caledonium]|uniref:6396_t:CDS:1 n=1 Tax=Funneliformis caledonium TaxID=1117310 RepID=A0A9N9EFZ0_9GLOM|nr:6396_t:CDS:2 [Funneliformis caledonium]
MRWNPFNKPSCSSFILVLLSLLAQIIVSRADVNVTNLNNSTNASISNPQTPNTTLSTLPTATQTPINFKYGIANSSIKDYKYPATLSDGTLVFLVNIPKVCSERSIILQILYANGTTSIFDGLPQDPILFCNISFAQTLRVYPIDRNLVMVTYIVEIQSSLQHLGIIINVKKKVTLHNGKFYDYPQYSTITNASSLTLFSPNIDPKRGFLMAYFDYDGAYLVWWKWKDNDLKKVYENRVALPNINISFETPGQSTSSVFPTKTGGFGIAYTTWNDQTSNDTLYVTGQVYLKFLGVDHELKGPFLIYQTSLRKRLGLNSCSVSYDKDAGYQCILEIDDLPALHSLKIDFWTTGSVINVTELGQDKINGGLIVRGQPLMTGGFLITMISSEGVNGYIINQSGDIVGDWGLPHEIGLISGVFPNNTAWALSSNSSDSSNFGIFSSKLKPLYNPSDYGNIFIKSTSPNIDGSVMINGDYELLSKITMEFNEPIKVSDESLSIYQIANDTYLLRQKIQATNPKLTLDKNNRILYLTNAIYSSSFNVPGGIYCIEMEHNFVRTLSEDEPLLGILKNQWKFTLADFDNHKSSGSRVGILRLRVDFSSKEKKGVLSKQNRKEFLYNLLNDISSYIPCDANRLKVIDSNFIELRNKGEQFAFKLKIGKPISSNEKEPSSQKIFSDLQEMIHNLDNTGLALSEYAKYLDQKSGLVEQGSIWERYKYVIIISLIGLAILIILYFVSERKFNQGRNISIFRYTLILTDFILDILFVVNNASEVQIIFIPSIIFIVIPATVNLTISVFINIYEISHNKAFQDWINRYASVTVWITLLAVADLKIMTLLTSRIAGLDCFKAPFSNKTISWIFWLSFVNLFLEDIPHFIIQVIFLKHSIAYDIIPTLTLITSVIVILADSLWRFYYSLMHLLGYYRNEEHFWRATDSDTEDSEERHATVIQTGQRI